MFHMVLNTSGFWTCLWFWICQGFLNIPEFWICLRFWIYKASGYTRNLNIPWVLNIPGFGACLWFWICKGSGYTGVLNMLVLDKVLDMPEYVWRISEFIWLCLNMSEYAWICWNMREYTYLMTFVLHFLFVTPCLLECVVTYFKIYTKLEVVVWRNMRLFSWQGKIWFSI